MASSAPRAPSPVPSTSSGRTSSGIVTHGGVDLRNTIGEPMETDAATLQDLLFNFDYLAMELKLETDLHDETVERLEAMTPRPAETIIRKKAKEAVSEAKKKYERRKQAVENFRPFYEGLVDEVQQILRDLDAVAQIPQGHPQRPFQVMEMALSFRRIEDAFKTCNALYNDVRKSYVNLPYQPSDTNKDPAKVLLIELGKKRLQADIELRSLIYEEPTAGKMLADTEVRPGSSSTLPSAPTQLIAPQKFASDFKIKERVPKEFIGEGDDALHLYQVWLQDWKAARIECETYAQCTKLILFRHLKSTLGGAALKKVSNLPAGDAKSLDVALQILDEAFNDPLSYVNTVIMSATSTALSDADRCESLVEAIDTLTAIKDTFQSVGVDPYEHLLLLLFQTSLPAKMHARWYQYKQQQEHAWKENNKGKLYKKGDTENVHYFKKFCKEYKAVAKVADDDDPKPGSSGTPVDNSAFHVNKADFATRGGSKCILCRRQNHKTGQCRRVKKMSKEEFKEKAKRKGFCHLCLNRYTTGHKCPPGWNQCNICMGKHNRAVCDQNPARTTNDTSKPKHKEKRERSSSTSSIKKQPSKKAKEHSSTSSDSDDDEQELVKTILKALKKKKEKK